jgi:hypothetical protein
MHWWKMRCTDQAEASQYIENKFGRGPSSNPSLSANKMDVPAPKAGHFVWNIKEQSETYERSELYERRGAWRSPTKFSANEHPFCLTPPLKGSAKPIPPSPLIK